MGKVGWVRSRKEVVNVVEQYHWERSNGEWGLGQEEVQPAMAYVMVH